ncbi:MAG TPA: hypothetical protein P5527_11170 [Kiritimatiellia bacterium]|nr:hypothetical protein [Kiritimatiellia bacterium]
MITQEGRYTATVDAVSVGDGKSGSLLMTCLHTVDMPDGTTEQIKSVTTLVSKDGVVMVKNIERVKEWSGWDGNDVLDLMTIQMPERVSLTIRMEPGFVDKEHLYPKVAWVNPVGGGAAADIPAPISRDEFAKKYAAKFRALGGTAATKPTAPRGVPAKPTAPLGVPAKPSTAKAQPANPAASMTVEQVMEKVWNAFGAANDSLDQPALEAAWFAFVDAGGGGKPQDAITREEWLEMWTKLEPCPF